MLPWDKYSKEIYLSGSSLELLHGHLVNYIPFRVTILFNCVIQRSALLDLPNSFQKVVKSSLFFLKFKVEHVKHSLTADLHIISKMCDFAFDIPQKKINRPLQMQNIEVGRHHFPQGWSHIASFASGRLKISLKNLSVLQSQITEHSLIGLERASVPYHPWWPVSTGWVIQGLDKGRTLCLVVRV